ncbi:IgA FC receptor [Labeo rohita]|uniref:IgA FC receptor n=1 Tax=Labeo rohita TaxID=84645 RepID=A0ABQ8MKR4_LABRO|nr:IgA FC receptor [Labeo rohita]
MTAEEALCGLRQGDRKLERWGPTYRTNGSDRLPCPKRPHVIQGSIRFLSLEPPAAARSKTPAAPRSRPPASHMASYQYIKDIMDLTLPMGFDAPILSPSPMSPLVPSSPPTSPLVPSSPSEHRPEPTPPERRPEPAPPERHPEPAPPEPAPPERRPEPFQSPRPERPPEPGPPLPDLPWPPGLCALPWLPELPDPPWLPELPDPPWRPSSSLSCVCPARASRPPTPPPRRICYAARRTFRGSNTIGGLDAISQYVNLCGIEQPQHEIPGERSSRHREPVRKFIRGEIIETVDTEACCTKPVSVFTQFPIEELELRPLEVAMGNVSTRYWPATAYDVTAGATHHCWRVIPARPHCIKGHQLNTTSSSSSSATVLFEACKLYQKEGQPSVPHGSGPAAAEARRKLSSWGSQLLEDDDVISLTSSDPAASDLLGSTQEEQELLDEEMQPESSQTSYPAYDELLEVMERTTARLDLPWERVKKVSPRGRLDEHFLSDHNSPAQVSLPFLPDLHSEVVKAWNKPFSSRIHRFQHTSYANIERMRENGYERMPHIEETLASYLSLGEASSLNAPSLPSEPLQRTSCLNGRAYTAAGQAVASLHTMAVLQAYQADLLKDLDKGQGLSPDKVSELRHRFGSPGHQAGRHCHGKIYGGHGGYGEASLEPSFLEGPGLSPNIKGVLASPGLRIGTEGRSSRSEGGGPGEAFPMLSSGPK